MSRPESVKSVGKLLEEALSRRLTIHENGQERKMRAQDVIIRGLVNDAARRNAQALKLLFALMDRYGASGEREIDLASLQAGDQAIIDGYLASLQAQPRGEVAQTKAITPNMPDDQPAGVADPDQERLP